MTAPDAGHEAGETGGFEYNERSEEGHGSADTDRRTRSSRILAEFLQRRVPGRTTDPAD